MEPVPVVAPAQVVHQDLADIHAAVDKLALDDPDTNQMVQLMTQMSRQLSSLNI